MDREATLKDLWRDWVRVPFNSLLRNAPKFKKEAVDDVFDDIMRDIAPMMVVEIQKQLSQKHFDTFVGALRLGAIDGVQERRPQIKKHQLMYPNYTIRKGQDIDWYAEGYLLGYESPSIVANKRLRKTVHDTVIQAIIKQERDDVTENVVKTKLYNAWMAINPVELVKVTIKMVKKHGWKVGAALALIQIIETAVVPVVVTSLGFPEYALVASQLPITEVTIPIMAKYLKIEVGEPTETEELDEYISRNTTRFAMQKLSFEEKQVVNDALSMALGVVSNRAKSNQTKMLNLMSRVEFDKYRHQELMQLSKSILATNTTGELVRLLNQHSDILVELAEVSQEASRMFKRNKVRVKRR